MESHGLMFELSHPDRLKILNILRKKSMRLSQLSKKLSLNTAEVSRHLDRLDKARLIDRNRDSEYFTTSFANIVLSGVSRLDFLIKNIDFFLNHDFSKIPENYRWFNAMEKGSFIEGTLEILSWGKDASTTAKKYVKVISEDAMRMMVDFDCQKNEEGVVFKKMYPKSTEIPQEWVDRVGETFEIRTIDEIPLGIKLNEKMAGISFFGLNGNMDYNIAIIGDDELFQRWASSLFDYYWERGDPFK